MPRELLPLVLQSLNGLAFSMLLFQIAAGLSLIFGLLRFVNLAHGAFYMLGAYLGFALAAASGSFWAALVFVPLGLGLAAVVLEVGLLRPLYRRPPLEQVLLTFGLAFVLGDLVRWLWGGDVRSVAPPPQLARPLQIAALGLVYPRYRLFVLASGLALAVVLGTIQRRTRIGAIIRAGVQDPGLVDALGINVSRVFTCVFACGIALAAYAGVVAGPFLSLQLDMGFSALLYALIVVVIGGLGTLKGAFTGSLLVGLADTFGSVLWPDLSLLMIFAVMAVVLVARPTGLFGRGLA